MKMSEAGSLRRRGASSLTALSLLAALLMLSITTPCVDSMSMVPSLCAMPGCTCARHLEDDSISELTCVPVPGIDKFTVMPNLRQFPNLTQLNLEGHEIRVVRRTDFDTCRGRLILIDLDSNDIRTIEEGAFRNMPKLEHLLMAHNRLTEVPADIFRGKDSFPTLNLGYNLLTSIPKGFVSVREYITVKLNDNPIGNLELFSLVGNLTKIVILDLSNVGMTVLDTFGAGFWAVEIEELFLNDNHFPVLNYNMLSGLQPDSITDLSLRSCGIQVIKRAAFASTHNLRRLLLDGNNITLLRRGPFEGLHLDILDLASCNISEIKMTAFKDVSVRRLLLQNNNISIINNKEFQGLRGVDYLDLTNCSIHEIRGSPFVNLTELITLLLPNNFLTDDSYEKALKRHDSLEIITLSGNLLTRFPPMPVPRFPRMHSVFITHNHIRNISRAELGNMTALNQLFIGYNPLEGFPEDDDTFADCGRLRILDLDHTLLTRLPNLTYLPHLVELAVNHARLNHMPADICCTCSQLGILEAENNHLTNLPTLACRRMTYLDFSHNRLEVLHDDFLKGMKHINTLDLRENRIRDLPHDFFAHSVDMGYLHLGGNELTRLPDFRNMPHLIMFNASYNRIRKLHNHTFSEQGLMEQLFLNDNDIDYIDPTAFPVHSVITILNLSRNGRLREWVVPIGGFPRLGELYLEEMFQLHQVPHAKDLPAVTELRLTYTYHCCIFEEFPGFFVPNVTTRVEDGEGSGELIVVLPTAPDITNHPTPIEGECGPLPEDMANIQKYFPDLIAIVDPITCIWSLTSNSSFSIGPEMFDTPEAMQNFLGFISSRSDSDFTFTYRARVRCVPHENPLTPCQYLLDPWILKIAIWAVWVLALLGNGTVLFIGIATREKLESNEFLICNLAFADFCMGVYLAFLAIVDVRTFGSSFFQSALDWQLGPGCKAAGFIAVFSSELSIYTLVVLTLERVYTISHAFNQNEAKRRRVVIFLCVLGWVVAAGLAALPLFDINSYNHVAVCLPYLTERPIDKAYIGSILSLNFVSFLVIIVSYVYIFGVVCKSAPPTNASQRRKDVLIAATKIAVVIVTAFLCWAPIAVIGYLAIADIHLVDAKEAKYFIVFVYPLNACVDPFIYAIFTKRFRSKFGSMFRRSKGRVTSFPQNHHMRLQRIPSGFTSEYQMSKVSSASPTNRQEELTRLRQSRRSSSLVVQMVGTNAATPSPTFHPPSGCNLGRRASLPPGFGSTLNMAGIQDPSNPNLPHYSIVPFRLSSIYSSDNSSLPNLQEESAMDLEADAVFSSSGPYGDDLTSSQESNLRRLSVVKEEEEVMAAGNPEGNPEEEEDPEEAVAVFAGDDVDDDDDDDGFSESSAEEYSDASDSVNCAGVDGTRGTDLDHMMQQCVDIVVHEESRSSPPPPAHVVGAVTSSRTPSPTSQEKMEKEWRRKKTSSPPMVDSAYRSKAYSCEDLHMLGIEYFEDSPFVSSSDANILAVGRSLEGLVSCRVQGADKTETSCVSNLYNSESGRNYSSRADDNGSHSPPLKDHAHSGCGHKRDGTVIGTEVETYPDQVINSQQTLIKSLHISSAQPTPPISNIPPASTPLSHAPTQNCSDTSQTGRPSYPKSRGRIWETDL